ncbi:MAG: GNAT family N-acetyltransferase [Smithellaceae bacterium]|jgi:GNAT superfamily N-acetyltransferase|nr:GNAT family N-acetyltransferase [Syntrophaceae bacterium]MDD4240156.1 GNAT family N-acetyltransferase [Smithellaceae bacterium]NLX51356.1 GNAT family N-acetyltransferase [Deltaproteobacteria bacterium]
MNQLAFRHVIQPSDLGAILNIVQSSGFFSAEEVELACELAADRLEHGQQSSYQFLFAEDGAKVVGYACYGRIPATAASYDLYWIAVADVSRGRGLGSLLLQKTEDAIRACGGKRLYAETSSRPQYAPTHRFYESCGYGAEALLQDFYAPGDSKIIYAKRL